ncbi:unnamed protein product [Nesidiocoris tenuis]|uniref:Uncharacterized protein n=1 Tax=Nesidiocoris tenuis TaxID=355587 RepID=A0A6H5GB38_9HEMI|nr:unnamed protein product [Nesidiocoris tenuis]
MKTTAAKRMRSSGREEEEQVAEEQLFIREIPTEKGKCLIISFLRKDDFLCQRRFLRCSLFLRRGKDGSHVVGNTKSLRPRTLKSLEESLIQLAHVEIQHLVNHCSLFGIFGVDLLTRLSRIGKISCYCSTETITNQPLDERRLKRPDHLRSSVPILDLGRFQYFHSVVRLHSVNTEVKMILPESKGEESCDDDTSDIIIYLPSAEQRQWPEEGMLQWASFLSVPRQISGRSEIVLRHGRKVPADRHCLPPLLPVILLVVYLCRIYSQNPNIT